MAAYTIEDIELIRRKSGISYQEAVSLLDYHNGNVARALVDLERNGRIQSNGEPAAKSATTSNASSSKTVNKGAIMNLITKLYRARLKVKKDEMPIINVSVLFSILSVLISPHLVIVGLIICLILGYKFSLEKHDHAFDSENLEKMVRNAAENVKSSVNDFAKSFQNGSETAAADAEEQPVEQRSYYASKGASAASASYRPSAPTLNVPVQVESQDGSVTMESESDGYNSATIE